MAASLKDQIQELMGKLNPGSIVGLDIGAHSIKVCELSGASGKFKLERFGLFQLSEAAIIEDEVQKPSEIVDGILEVFARSKIKSKLVCFGLSGPNTTTKRMNVPEGSKEEIEDHIMWEAEQYITFGADESQISFHIIGDNEGGGKDAMIAAARTDVIDAYTELIKEAKLTPKIVDLNVLAISNIFEESYKDKLDDYNEGTLILDVGAQNTKIIVFKNNAPIFTKEIPVGGGLITEEIQRQMGVSYEEAEDLKITTDDNGNLPEEILNIINMQLDAHIAEIRKNINFYVAQGSTDRVSSCFVTGGGSLAVGFVEKMSASSGLEVERLDPFRRIKFDERKFDQSVEAFGAIATVAIGLAMRKD